MVDPILFWWCKKCKKNVDIMLAPGVGVFCNHCASKVTMPKNIEKPPFFDYTDEDLDELIDKL